MVTPKEKATRFQHFLAKLTRFRSKVKQNYGHSEMVGTAYHRYNYSPIDSQRKERSRRLQILSRYVKHTPCLSRYQTFTETSIQVSEARTQETSGPLCLSFDGYCKGALNLKPLAWDNGQEDSFWSLREKGKAPARSVLAPYRVFERWRERREIGDIDCRYISLIGGIVPWTE